MNTNTLTKPIVSTQASPARYTTSDMLPRVNEIIDDSLGRIITSNKNILASADRLYKHPFGRDAAISTEKLLRYDTRLARQAILLMATIQGVKNDPNSEEEPGKIFHELMFRSENPEQQVIFDHLHTLLGVGDDKKFISYTAIDATLEFIHLVA